MNDITTLSISPDVLSQSSNTSDFTCCICMNICFDPVMLECCEKLLCITCLEKMLKVNKNIKCPYCNNKNFTFCIPPKLIGRFLENLMFKCPKCSEEVKYYFYHDHIYNTCKNKIENSFKFCKHCHTIYQSSNNNEEHNCKEYIKSLCDFDNKTALEKKIQILKLKILNIELPKEEIKQEDDGSILIPKVHIHRLYHTNNRTRPEYEQGWLCELCSDEIKNPLTMSYHCEKCTFDICEKCILYISSRVPNTKCHNHELNLEMRDCIWDCSICGDQFFKRHSWYCDICDFDVCVNCYWIEK